MSDAPEPKPCPFCENALFIRRHPFNGHDYVHHHSERSDRLGTNCPLSRTPVRLDVWNRRADLSVAEAARVLLEGFDQAWGKNVAIESENAREKASRGKHKWPVICREGVKAALRALAKEPSHD